MLKIGSLFRIKYNHSNTIYYFKLKEIIDGRIYMDWYVDEGIFYVGENFFFHFNNIEIIEEIEYGTIKDYIPYNHVDSKFEFVENSYYKYEKYNKYIFKFNKIEGEDIKIDWLINDKGEKSRINRINPNHHSSVFSEVDFNDIVDLLPDDIPDKINFLRKKKIDLLLCL